MSNYTSAFFKALCKAVESGYLKPFSSVEGMMSHASLKAESFEEGNFVFLRRDYSFSRQMTLQEALQTFIEDTKEWQKEWK